jgi:hypothetical protein
MFTPFAFVKSPSAGGAPAFDYVLGYTSSFVAYSIARQLSSTYTGSAIRVQRSSDSTTQDIGFVNNVLDTTSLNSFVGAGTGTVTILYDQSGNGVNLTGTSTIIASGVMYTSSVGIPAVKFDGSSQFLARTTAFTSNKVTEVMSICSVDAYTTNGLFWCNPDNGYSFGPYETGGGAVSTVDSAGTRLGQTSVSNGTIMFVDQFNNVGGGTNNAFLWINGSANNYTLSNSSWNAASFNKINLGRGPFGASFYTNGRVSEWIMFQDTDSQRSSIRTNIDNFYNTY